MDNHLSNFSYFDRLGWRMAYFKGVTTMIYKWIIIVGLGLTVAALLFAGVMKLLQP